MSGTPPLPPYVVPANPPGAPRATRVIPASVGVPAPARNLLVLFNAPFAAPAHAPVNREANDTPNQPNRTSRPNNN